MQADLTDVLNEIECPDLGIGIVDMGLVYVAEWNRKGYRGGIYDDLTIMPFR